ncbi:NlpC/P60 family protein [Nocardiopsis sp. RSe5-2]|uniref:NlpC/P60 family protein n=1 Tax=Nocardiopsis endophytica TaxID=3018445 RepID=A0ABT4UB43_9ACTN|nr:NlpC/P60 family protein [Nocardiopsis endophytica]MDA2814155.1 NlpC/P60 family protein [Nocardiopsis endophytica]
MHEPRERGSNRRRLAAAGFVAAGALLASTALSGTASADPSADDVRERIEDLEKEYSEQAEAYNQAKQDHDAAQEKLDDIKADKKEAEKELEDMQSGVRSLATAAYSGEDFSSVPYLATSSGPEDALRQASDMGYLSQSQQDRLDNYVEKKNKLERIENEADETEADAKERLDDAEEAKDKAEEKIQEQQDLLDELTEEERAAATEGVDGGGEDSSSGGGGASAPQGNGNAQAAINFIYAQIGDSYSLGANGPDVWDCSSLVQAAWREAGVSLPRTTYDQVNAGTNVSWDQMQPGDLIFFYGGPDHVGMYVGGGKMVHASNPSKPVAEVQLNDYYRQNFHSAVRVG